MFWAADAAEHQAAEKMKQLHDQISCDNVSIYYLLLADNSVLVLCRLPISDSTGTARMAMYPIKRAHREFKIPCVPLPCLAPELKGFTDPTKFVDMIYKDPNAPVFRGMEGQREAPMFPQMTAAECVRNLDGSLNFVIHTGDLTNLKSREEYLAASEGDQFQYNKEIGDWCMESIIAGMKNVKLNPAYMFEMVEEDGKQVPNGESKIGFLHELLPNLRKGCDMYVCLPPINDAQSESPTPNWGNGSRGAFSMAFRFQDDKLMPELPLPGLVHNVEQGLAVETPDGEPMDVEATTTKVNEDFYLYTNRSIDSSPAIDGTFFAWDDVQRHVDKIDTAEQRDAILKAQPPQNALETEPDWFTYKTVLRNFQNKQAAKIEDELDQLLSRMSMQPTLKQDLLQTPDMKVKPCIVNLRNTSFSNDAVSVSVSELGQHSIDMHIKSYNWVTQGRGLVGLEVGDVSHTPQEDSDDDDNGYRSKRFRSVSASMSMVDAVFEEHGILF